MTYFINSKGNGYLASVARLGKIALQGNGDGIGEDGTIIPAYVLDNLMVSMTPVSGDWQMLWCDGDDFQVTTCPVQCWGQNLWGAIVPVAGPLASPCHDAFGWWGIRKAGSAQVIDEFGCSHDNETDWRESVKEDAAETHCCDHHAEHAEPEAPADRPLLKLATDDGQSVH